ncbi:MAG: type II toxin-antitoxin system RelE/ParE family toxin [Clostridiales bacterium]|nr:type II toxin-antitoxin system RelE/ParE family toxin [Clostridiales bacterium]
MQLYTIKISEAAEVDLENAGDYIAFELLNPQAAENTIKGIREQVNRLSRFPESHELDDDPVLAELGVRKIYYKDYKIFFIIDKEHNVVSIVRILHMLVDSRAWLYRTFHI